MKIGVLVPFTNTTIEADLMQMCPDSSTVHFTRIGGYDVDDVPDSSQMLLMGSMDISEPLRLISAVSPNVIFYGCTSATLSHGLKFDEQLADTIMTTTGSLIITAAGALISSLNALNVKKIGFVSPYVPVLNDLSIKFFSDAGYETVARGEFDGELDSLEQGALTPDEIFELALKADSSEVEVIVIACTDLKAVAIIDRLEKATNKPVITSNQAMMFMMSKMFPKLNYEKCSGRIFNL